MSKLYELGPFVLDPQAGVLTRSGAPTAVGSRGVAVLAALLEHPSEYVSKSRIMDAAWPGLVVEESNLAVQISAIRHVLAQVPGGEHWVETLPRRGYRFVGPVTEVRDRQSKDASAEAKCSNLSEPLTSFVGRERELVEIKRLLPRKRLLTLVGVGGIGKTRLALQVAAEVVAAYRDGVWLAELGSITDPLLVPTTVAQVLGVQERTGTPLTDTLCSQLKGRQLLLILDNCEHLLDASATLADAILRAAADVTIVATSREPLQVAAEQLYPLQSLSLPDLTASMEVMASSEAVQLFVERAQRQQPSFELTNDRAPAVAQLCVHLDGIPLALELAAARLRSLSIEQINARLDDRFSLLTRGSRTALPRQQTLRATIDWSFDLLAEDERVLLRRLAVFPGSFTLEAASSVASDERIDDYAVIDLLSQLVARSLVVADTSDAGARYRLLETTRAYALEKLGEAGETDAIKRRHAQYFSDRFGRAYSDWLRMSDADWRAIYAPELDNVRAALDWALGAGGETAIGTALAGASGAMWAVLSLDVEGEQRLQAAAARLESQTPQPDQAPLWLWRGVLAGAPAQAVGALERAIVLYRLLGDTSGLGHSLVRLGRMLTLMGRFEQAAAVLSESFPALECSGSRRALAFYFTEFGFLDMLTGNASAARMHFEKAFRLYSDAGAESAALAVASNLADMSWALGDLDAALTGFRDTIARLRNFPLVMARKRNIGMCLTNLAGVHTERGELDKALAAAREGLPLLNETGFAWSQLDHLALRAALAQKLANAAKLAGYVDSMFAAKESARQPNEARARNRLQALLGGKVVPDELERLLLEGSKMTEEEACGLALEE